MDIYNALQSCPLFQDLDNKALRALVDTAEWIELRGGKTLYTAGDSGDALYLVVNGRIRALRTRPDGTQHIRGEAALGETVGEISVLTGEPRSVTAIAVRDSGLIRISSTVFQQLLARHPQAMLRVTRLIIQRVRQSGEGGERNAVSNTRTYAMLPAHDGIDIRGFAQSYAQNLGAGGSVLRLDAERVEQALGKDAAETTFDDENHNRRVAAWLNRLEERYRYLVYQASNRPDAWTRRCLRQADRVLVLAHADREPADVGNLPRLQGTAPGAAVELVLLHADVPPQAETIANWRQRSGATFHYHLHASLPSGQMGRLARLSSGRGVCLVLGGGGARGFAHVGLLRALAERGVPVDAVGGTSMGALVAAMVASGMGHEDVLERLRATFVEKNYLNDYSIATRMRISMIGGKKFLGHLREIFGDQCIEALPLPFYCVSSNLSNGSAVVHRRGPVASWVGASMAVPGIAPPLVYRGDLLVDGGLLHSVPLDPMRAMGRGPVLVSDVGIETDLRLEGAAPDAPELLNDIADVPKHLTIFKILFHSATLASERDKQSLDEHADLAIHMPVGDTGMFDWDEIDNIVYQAYYHACEVLDHYLQEHPGSLPMLPPASGSQ